MIVTAIDEGFYTPLVALRNSLRVHSPEVPLACLTYGGDDLARRVEALGIEVRHNVTVADYLPDGEGTDANCQPMYARLLAPMMFGDCAWFDADQVAISDVSPLFKLRFTEPVAAVRAPRHTIQQTVIGLDAPEGDSFYSGLMVFNSEAWKAERVTERCLELMRLPGVRWRFVVQSVLAVVLADRFYRLDKRWQGFANRREFSIDGHAVLHWHGRKLKPWTHEGMPNSHIWRKYFCMSS